MGIRFLMILYPCIRHFSYIIIHLSIYSLNPSFTVIFSNAYMPGQPTPVFLPGESRGQSSLMGCRLWGRTESATTEAT